MILCYSICFSFSQLFHSFFCILCIYSFIHITYLD